MLDGILCMWKIRLAKMSCRASYTTSLASNITDYKIENGRRYHAYKEGSRSPSTSTARDLVNSNGLGYPYPNDEVTLPVTAKPEQD